MHKVNMHEAKTKLSGLVEEALSEKEVVIPKVGGSIVRLILTQKDISRRKPGRFKDSIKMASDFDETPEEIIEQFLEAKR